MRHLTRKQENFVKEYIATGVGSDAVLKSYNTTDPRSAAVIASQNLANPVVQRALADRISDDELEAAHKSLLTQVRLDYFVFPRSMQDEEITEHVEAQGLTVLNIRPSDKGKLAFFTLPDAAARGKGVELGYKLKGSFAPEKHANLNVNVNTDTENDVDLDRIISEIEDKLKHEKTNV